MEQITALLKFPLTLLRMALEATDAPYSLRDRLHIFSVLVKLRFGEIFQQRNKIIHARIFGYRIHAYDYTTLLFLFREIYLTRDYEFSSDTDQPIILDCGSNIGMSVFFHKNIHPDAVIHCFEPNPSAFELLRHNVEFNQLKGITLHAQAVSDSTLPIQLYVNDDKGSLLSSVNAERGGTRAIEIPSVLLSDYLKPAPVMIKIDVEGAEWAILNDLKNHPEKLRHVPHIIVEYHHRMNGDPSRMSEFLHAFEALGYQYNIRSHFKKTGDFQDLILHFYR